MDHLPPPITAPAGWYPDPVTGGLRYFDGVGWYATVVQAPAERGFVVEQVEEHPRLPFVAALGALGVLVVSLVVGKAVVGALADRGWPLVTYIAISAVLSYGPSIGWLWYVRGRWGAGRFAAVGWRFRWADLGWGPITWVAAIGVQILLAAMVLLFGIPLSSNVESISEGDADRAYLVATAIAAVVAAPVVEELVFRGLVLRGLLSRLGPVIAIALQGILFGAAHADPARGVGNVGLVIVLSGVGIVLGTTAYLTRRLGAVVIAHAIFNGVVVALLLSGVFDDVDRSVFERGSAVVELEVVDESDVAEPDRGEHHGRSVGPLDLGEGLGVHQLDVLEPRTPLGFDRSCGDRLEGRRVAFAGRVAGRGGTQCP
jgi:membrane protease YdiL (CAAX protease family)